MVGVEGIKCCVTVSNLIKESGSAIIGRRSHDHSCSRRLGGSVGTVRDA